MLANKIFYNGTTYANDVAGSKKSVHALTKEKIQDYMSKYYVPSNVVISFAGNVQMEEAEKLVEKYFLHNFNNSLPYDNKINLQSKIEQNQIKAYKDNEQAIVCISFPGLSDSADKTVFALNMFDYAFGGGMNSRLFQRIREKLGLVYSINVTKYINNAGGDVTIHFATSSKNVPLALNAIRQEVDKVKQEGMTEKEFINVKNRYLSSVKMSYENTNSVGLRNAKRLAFYGNTRSKQDTIDLINQVTLEDINTLIQRIFDYDKCCISYVGKNSKINLWKHFN